LREGYIGADAARDVYRVVTRDDFNVDEDATRALRAAAP
jgi:hypothetical protein